jgi:hypothetical protein
MIKRSLLRWTACVLAGTMVSVQAAFAFAACVSPEREPARAIAQMDVPPCHEQESKTDGLCVLHCLGDRQSLDKPSVKLPSLGEAPVLVVLTPMLHSAPYVRRHDAPVRVSAPPSRILFSKLLI